MNGRFVRTIPIRVTVELDAWLDGLVDTTHRSKAAVIRALLQGIMDDELIAERYRVVASPA